MLPQYTTPRHAGAPKSNDDRTSLKADADFRAFGGARHARPPQISVMSVADRSRLCVWPVSAKSATLAKTGRP